MAKLDIKRLVKRSLERVKQSEHISDSDPSILHLEENVVRSIAELEVARAPRITSNPAPARPSSGQPVSSPDKPSPNKPTQAKHNHLGSHARKAA